MPTDRFSRTVTRNGDTTNGRVSKNRVKKGESQRENFIVTIWTAVLRHDKVLERDSRYFPATIAKPAEAERREI